MRSSEPIGLPDCEVSARELFGLRADLKVPAFSARSEHVPPLDPAYRFNEDTTLAILAGFVHNRRVLVQGHRSDRARRNLRRR